MKNKTHKPMENWAMDRQFTEKKLRWFLNRKKMLNLTIRERQIKVIHLSDWQNSKN